MTLPGEAARTIIDVHTHVVPALPDHAARLGDERWPTFVVEGEKGQLVRDGVIARAVGPVAWDMDARVAAMSAAGVDRHVLSPIPPVICDWGGPADAEYWSRALNESIASMVAQHPDRLIGMGSVSLHHPGQLVRELEHAHSLGLVGVEIGTGAGGRELDDPALLPFYEAAEGLGMRLFVHPLLLGAEAGWTDRIRGQEATFGLGMSTDTAIAATRLAFGGVTARHPALSVCLAHGGGTFFWALPRLARLWDGPDRAPEQRTSQLTSGFVVDTVVYDPRNVRHLVEVLGSPRVLHGTDYPLPVHQDLTGGIVAGLTNTDQRQVLGDSALTWLGLART